MAYEGFSKVASSIQAEGKSKGAADAIAAAIGRRKIGQKAMTKRAEIGRQRASKGK